MVGPIFRGGVDVGQGAGPEQGRILFLLFGTSRSLAMSEFAVTFNIH
jgi:hypothetical protein